MITHHTQLLNALIKKYNLKSYLEIGVRNPANNFDKIKCHIKTGIDPMPVIAPDKMDSYKHQIHFLESDLFFKTHFINKYDLIFIDGLHHADQVKRDFENSLNCLNDNGFIVIHDCLPKNENTTHVPRDNTFWHGSVYKFCMNMEYYSVKSQTYSIDNGCMVIERLPGISPQCFLPPKLMDEAIKAITWDLYLSDGKQKMMVQPEINI
jgi:hypothetical protein